MYVQGSCKVQLTYKYETLLEGCMDGSAKLYFIPDIILWAML